MSVGSVVMAALFSILLVISVFLFLGHLYQGFINLSLSKTNLASEFVDFFIVSISLILSLICLVSFLLLASNVLFAHFSSFVK